MNIGFTGTQDGMTREQMITFREYMKNADEGEFHHGDCVGSDAQAHAIVRNLVPGVAIHLHPPVVSDKRARCKADVVWPKAAYLTRNKAIVSQSDKLVATPKGPEEVRSGTWSTIRYARKLGRPVTIIYPDGSVSERP